MTGIYGLISELEQKARQQWLAGSVDRRFGRCDSCGHVDDEEGRRLFVARQSNRRKYECLACWEQPPARSPGGRP